MAVQRLSFQRIKNCISEWKNLSPNKHIEIAALEPTLWNDDGVDIADLVAYLKAEGYTVSMTTNGSTLYKYAERLAKAGVDLIRISWHSMDEKLYAIITGGGRLDTFLKGVEAAVACQLPLSINRVLMRGFTSDLDEQIAYADKYRLRLKLLDLYWTESSKYDYEKYYISPEEALAPIKTKLKQEEHRHLGHGRDRVRLFTKNGGWVEYKLKSTVNRPKICNDCGVKNNCLEGFGDYLRLYPDGKMSLCYLRDDLGVNAFDIDDKFDIPSDFYSDYLSSFIDGIPLRLVLEGRCNFNCGFPTSKESWCLKQGKGFFFPRRKDIIVVNVD